MAKIINPGRPALTLPTLHVVPRESELVTTNDVILHTDNWPILQAMQGAGQITIELDAITLPTSPVYPTDPVTIAPETPAAMVYPTDPVVVPSESPDTPVYPTDPVTPEAAPEADTPVYPTDPLPEPEPDPVPDPEPEPDPAPEPDPEAEPS